MSDAFTAKVFCAMCNQESRGIDEAMNHIRLLHPDLWDPGMEDLRDAIVVDRQVAGSPMSRAFQREVFGHRRSLAMQVRTDLANQSSRSRALLEACKYIDGYGGRKSW